MEQEQEPVWEATYNDRFYCRAERCDGKEGRQSGLLTMRDASQQNRLVLITQIIFTNGAVMGPDIDDLLEWQAVCKQRINAILFTEK